MTINTGKKRVNLRKNLSWNLKEYLYIRKVTKKMGKRMAPGIIKALEYYQEHALK